MTLSTRPNAFDALHHFQMAPWIASRSYEVGTGEARAAISNERRHEFLVLENESAELWSRLEKGIAREELLALARTLGVAELLPSFLNELAEAELLADVMPPEEAACLSALTPLPSKPLQDAANTNSEHEMMQWVADNFGQETTRRPLLLIQLDDKHAHFDPKASGTANFIAQATGSGCGNCGSGGCTTTASTHVRRANVAFDGGPGLELMSGSAETATVLRGFAELRQRYLAKVSS